MTKLDKMYPGDVRGKIHSQEDPPKSVTVLQDPMLAEPGPHSGSRLHSLTWGMPFQ